MQPAQSDAESAWRRATAMLASGDWENGWREFERRWELPEMRPRAIQPGRPWRGEHIPGKTIFVYGEQGFGDIIQFARFIPAIKARGLNVLLGVNPELQSLLSRLAPIAQPGAQFHGSVAIGSLPFIFGITPQTLPREPYLASDPEKARAWSGRISVKSFRVGLVWATHDRIKSLPAELLASLQLPGVTLYSLQKNAPAIAGVVDCTSELRDFSDTAAMIANLDLVISIDTAVLHLAGAMGKSSIAMLLHRPDWRWHLGGEFSLWYPSVRMVRQTRPGDWNSVVNVVRQLIERNVGSRTC